MGWTRSREFQALRARIIQVGGGEGAEVRERAAEGDDLILEAVVEIGDVRPPARSPNRRCSMPTSVVMLRSGLKFGLLVKPSSKPSGGRMPVPPLAWRRVAPQVDCDAALPQ